jgi:hypothetical protein
MQLLLIEMERRKIFHLLIVELAQLVNKHVHHIVVVDMDTYTSPPITILYDVKYKIEPVQWTRQTYIYSLI